MSITVTYHCKCRDIWTHCNCTLHSVRGSIFSDCLVRKFVKPQVTGRVRKVWACATVRWERDNNVLFEIIVNVSAQARRALRCYRGTGSGLFGTRPDTKLVVWRFCCERSLGRVRARSSRGFAAVGLLLAGLLAGGGQGGAVAHDGSVLFLKFSFSLFGRVSYGGVRQSRARRGWWMAARWGSGRR